MKEYLKIYRFRMIVLAVLLIVRQLLLVFAQYLNGETFVGLVNKDTHYFLVIILLMIGSWAIIIGLDRFSKIYENNLCLDIHQSIRHHVASKM